MEDMKPLKKFTKLVGGRIDYKWFTRLVAIRFMEVNDYLPSRVRVLSSHIEGKTEPDIITKPFDTGMVFTKNERELIIKLKSENKLDELLTMLFIKQCNELNELLPTFFDTIEDPTEATLKLTLIGNDSIVKHLLDIPEEHFKQVQVVGWLHQLFQADGHREVYKEKASNQKFDKEKIPVATQIFTPEWIVRYMVDNSLGRCWKNEHKESFILSELGYYVEPTFQTKDVEKQFEKLQCKFGEQHVMELKFLEPCMGSGNILVYAFDVFMKIYLEQGYSKKIAVLNTFRHNLRGLDIDEKAFKICYFALMMKGRQYDEAFLFRGITPKIHLVKKTPSIDNLDSFGLSLDQNKREVAIKQIQNLFETFKEADEYGYVLKVSAFDSKLLKQFIYDLPKQNVFYLPQQLPSDLSKSQSELLELVDLAETLSQKYDVIVSNPPYMGSGGMGSKLKKYGEEYYKDTKNDLFSMCIEKAMTQQKELGFMAMVVPESLMFLTSHETLRKRLVKEQTLVNMVHTAVGLFENGFGTTAFVCQNMDIEDYNSTFIDLRKQKNSEKNSEEKERKFLDVKREIAFTNMLKRFENAINEGIGADVYRVAGCNSSMLEVSQSNECQE